ncbi:penicillin-binding protein 1C [Wenyingzhuangia heitensis]|uniref:peptidoglycan glycosyltransferase n=1 Tax=Wenyingzhuangia heitensis TaxID=1487859 RepID=A0ABX0U9T4_9FLAO|nr:penicillin-binding protein 1C [Wenyingzhuangia heitensis]NIJ45503.1 penicillin-binding protein 1C [Wenyingzhuangia heitensis]
MKKKITLYILKHKIKIGLGLILCFWYGFFLPSTLFNKDYSTVIFSKNHSLLGATIANDEQWRFPPSDSIPFKFKNCIVYYEDEYFKYHLGFNPIAIGKAIMTNYKTGKNKRGASTLTQQVIRLSRNKKRTYTEKFIELIWATRLEFSKSKEEILNLYANHAPYGGNVVGLEMASWRYFGTSPQKLSWAESATLAVLPNAPGLIFPGKNKHLLKQKRDFLLKKLKDKGIINTTTYELSIQEKIPTKPVAIPQENIHLISHLKQHNKGKRITTSIDANIQQQVLKTVQKFHHQYRKNNIHNLAVLVLDVETKKVVSYVGNSPTTIKNEKYVDMIQAQRSTGSTLKPVLYMGMLNSGELLPNLLVPDVPTQIQEYNPQNFNFTYSGAISAKKALAKSLNIPAVRLLRTYGLHHFKNDLNYLGLKGVNKPVDYYGLTLILGGAESSLWDITNMYANLAGTVNHYNSNNGNYFSKEHQPASFYQKTKTDFGKKSIYKNIFDAGSIYLGFDAITELTRPEDDKEWKHYNSSHKISWKTGTSFGNKDAWSIGVTQKYAIGVWVGNADGEGIANMTGVNYAAPVMFNILESLPQNNWFKKPMDELQEIEVCSISGHKANPLCPTVKEFVPLNTNTTLPCPYHQKIYVDQHQKYRVFKNCADGNNITPITWFVLPANQAWYYKKLNANYTDLPPIDKNCLNANNSVMDFISPNENTSFILTKDFDEKTNPIVIKVSHQRSDEQLFWYVDDTYLKSTTYNHEIAIIPSLGQHQIIVIDQNGNQIKRNINIE